MDAFTSKKPCTFFAKGLCKNGDACRFAHVIATTANCKFGFECNRQDCKFSHPDGRKIAVQICRHGWFCTSEVCMYMHLAPRMRDTACEKCYAVPDEKCGFKHVAAATSPKNPAPLPPVSVAEVQATVAEVQAAVAEVQATVAEVQAADAVAPVAEVKIGESDNLKSLDEIKGWMEAYDGKGSDIVQIPEVKECFFKAIVRSFGVASKQHSEIIQKAIPIEIEIIQKRNAGANEPEIDQLQAQARDMLKHGANARAIREAINEWVAKNQLYVKFNKACDEVSSLITA